ncbi:hypothetical protein B0H12DRAFT_223758 [Mycena haematopus]|nr:hypothetical protein B0H12DRAFT_223758 [Mycena haematopus]
MSNNVAVVGTSGSTIRIVACPPPKPQTFNDSDEGDERIQRRSRRPRLHLRRRAARMTRQIFIFSSFLFLSMSPHVQRTRLPNVFHHSISVLHCTTPQHIPTSLYYPHL